MGALTKAYKSVSGLFPMVDKSGTAGNTTLSAAAAAGTSSLSVAAGTNFSNGDDIHVGDGETLELCRIASGGGTTTLTLEKKLLHDHASGEAVVETEALDLALPEAQGVTISLGNASTDVFVATQKLKYGKLPGYMKLGASWRYPVVTTDVIGFALGIPRSNIIGDGTAAAQTGTVGPRMFTTNGVSIGAARRMSVVVVGVLEDDTPLRTELYNLSFDPNALGLQLQYGTLTTPGVRVTASSGAYHIDSSEWAPANKLATYKASKADIYRRLSLFSELTDSGTATTTTSAISAGAFVIPVTSATGIVAGSVLRIGTGDDAEIHIVHGVATLNVNLRTQVTKAFDSGVAVVVQTKTKIAGVTGGFALGVQAQVTDDTSEDTPLTLGTRTGNVDVTMTTRLNNITPENLQRVYSMASGDYDQTRLPLTAKIGTGPLRHCMYEGVTMGGKNLTIIGHSATLNPAGDVTFSNGERAALPLEASPLLLTFMVNA